MGGGLGVGPAAGLAGISPTDRAYPFPLMGRRARLRRLPNKLTRPDGRLQ
jgi:hypothetical protein